MLSLESARIKLAIGELNKELRDSECLDTKFINRKDCIHFIRVKFGIDNNKNITFFTKEDGYYFSSKAVFMKCVDCENFLVEARLIQGEFVFVKDKCCTKHGNKGNIPCVSTFHATKVRVFVNI